MEIPLLVSFEVDPFTSSSCRQTRVRGELSNEDPKFCTRRKTRAFVGSRCPSSEISGGCNSPGKPAKELGKWAGDGGEEEGALSPTLL